MKIHNIYIGALLLLMGVTSCQNEEVTIDFGNDTLAVKVEASIGESIFSRSNPQGSVEEQKVFNTGDQIAISNEGRFVNYTYDGASWSANIPSEYLKWSSETMTFDAYYPVNATTNMQNFTLPASQSSVKGIAWADYMTVSKELTKNEVDPISLTFERKTARVIVKIASFGDQYTEIQKTVSDVKIVSGAESLSGTTATAVTPLANGTGAINSTYTALIIPTTAKSSETFITLTDGQSNPLAVTGIPAMEPGKSYTYDLHVGKDAVTVTNVTVADWTTGEIINEDTELVSPPAIGDYYYQNGTYKSFYINDESNPCIGLVYWTDPANEKHVKIVSLQEPPKDWNDGTNDAGCLQWSTERVATGATDENSGLACMREIMKITDWQTKYPAFAYAHAQNGDNPDYSDGSSVWCLPAKNELKALYAGWCGLRWVASGAGDGEINDWNGINLMPNSANYSAARDAFNTKFTTAKGTSLATDYYWSATEDYSDNACYVYFNNGQTYTKGKNYDNSRVRLVRDIIVP